MSPSAAAAEVLTSVFQNTSPSSFLQVAVDQEDGARQVQEGQAAAREDTEEATTGVRGPSEP